MKALPKRKGVARYLARLGLGLAPVRPPALISLIWVSEPHQDGTPHLHAVLFKGEAR